MEEVVLLSRQPVTVFVALCGAVMACAGDSAREFTAPDLEPAETPAITQSDTWLGNRYMVTPRVDAKAGTISGVIYVAGGRDEALGNSRVVEAYNVSTNSWTARAPLPSPRFAVNGVSAIDGRLYVTGGIRGDFGTGTPTRTLFVYDPLTNTWSKKADMPQVSAGGVQGVIGSRLYVYADAGGDSPGFYRYNPATDTWATLTPPPGRHWGGVGGVIDGKFYLAAGVMDGISTTNMTVHIYDPSRGMWTTGATMPPPAANNVSGAVLKGKLYVVSGATVMGGLTASVRAYDPATDTWEVKAPIPTKRIGAASAGAAGQLFIMGGQAGSGRITGKVEAYTP
jgi:N-acetylneuraminic acid mutarotase